MIQPSARAWMGMAGLAVATLLGGCAFPLFNVQERSAPRSYAYTPRPRGAASEAPPKETRASVRASTPALGPRQTSVLDPRPREVVVPAPKPAGSCYDALDRAGVRFERLAGPTPGVRWPLRLRGPVRGVIFEPLEKNTTYAVLDCRLALALVNWSADLRRARVRRVEYHSVYRPGARVGGDGAISGHAHGLAIDAARFELDSGEVLDVLSDWEGRERGRGPCPLRRDEASGSRVLRAVTCNAVDHKLFQVILTPHYDRAHANHVHLEVKPEVDWFYVR